MEPERKTLLQLRGLACGACHAGAGLRACTGCRRAWYCGPGCARDDWAAHGTLCGALTAADAAVPGLPRGAAPPPRDAAAAAAALRDDAWALADALGRLPATHELDVVTRGVRCVGCGRTPRELPPPALGAAGPGAGTFTACPSCLLAAACSPRCWAAARARHAGACRRLQALALAECLRHEIVVQGGAAEVPVRVPGPRVTRATALPGGGWPAYFAGRAAAVGAAADDADGAGPGPLYAASTDALSKPLAVAAALSAALPRVELWTAEELDVTVAGAGPWDASGLGAWEELLHLHANLRHLRVTMVGPECARPPAAGAADGAGAVWDDDDDEEEGSGAGAAGAAAAAAASGTAAATVTATSSSSCGGGGGSGSGDWWPLPVCAHCCRVGARVSFAFVPHTTYHEAAAAAAAAGGPPARPPALVAAFNAGLSRSVTQWAPTLRLLLDAGTPLLVTAVTEAEARRDERALAAALEGEKPAWALVPQPFAYASGLWQVEVLDGEPGSEAAALLAGWAPREARVELGTPRAAAGPGAGGAAATPAPRLSAGGTFASNAWIMVARGREVLGGLGAVLGAGAPRDDADTRGQ